MSFAMNSAMLAQSPSLAEWIVGNVPVLLAGLILFLGLVVGAGDLLKFSARRTWAISSVNFREAIRRRVLWVTPLAMLGIVAITQLSHPYDELDAIRQTTKYALFATAIVLVLTILILASTNLPREIDNRVIYTIVTKPATRLEIILGKTIGFARTSAMILLVMGLFTYLYLHINAAQLASSARNRLDTLPPGDLSRDTLQNYVSDGLLRARDYNRAAALNIFAQVPTPADPYRWTMGNGEQDVIYPFVLPASAFQGARDDAQLVFTLELAIRQLAMSRSELEESQQEPPPPAATAPSTRPATGSADPRKTSPPPMVSVSLLDPDRFTIVSAGELIDQMHIQQSRDPENLKNTQYLALEENKLAPAGRRVAIVVAPPKAIYERLKKIPPDDNGDRRFYLMVHCLSPGTRYGFAKDSVTGLLQLYDASGQPLQAMHKLTSKDAAGKPATPEPTFRGRLSQTYNQQLRGDADPEHAPVAIYHFRGAQTANSPSGGDNASFEFRVKIERSPNEAGDSDAATQVQVRVVNARTGFAAPPVNVYPESDRPIFFSVPRQAVADGDFDVQVRTRTQGHYVGLRNASLVSVAASRSFALNLLKSLLVLWMLAILVAVIAIFCSTFVSWPIAVVLTLLILLGRWAVTQIGESSPQQIFTEFFGSNTGAVGAKLFTETYRGLSSALGAVARILPDMTRFSVTEDIARGQNMTFRVLLDGLGVLGAFAIPLLVLGYMFFKRKEVAP